MKIKIKRRMTVEDVIDVTFPIYRRVWDCFEIRSWESIERIDANGDKWSITETDDGRGGREYEFEASRINIERDLGTYLEDDDQEPSSEAAFIEIVERAKAVLAKFPTVAEQEGSKP